MIYQTKTCTKCGYKIQNRQVRDEKIQIDSPFIKCVNCGSILIDSSKKEYIMGNKLYYIWYLVSNTLGYGAMFGLLLYGIFMAVFELEDVIWPMFLMFGLSSALVFAFLYNDFCEKKESSIERTKDLKYLKLLLDYNLISRIQYEDFIEEYNLTENTSKTIYSSCRICKYGICESCNDRISKRIEEKKLKGEIIECKVCGKEIEYNEFGICKDCQNKNSNGLNEKTKIFCTNCGKKVENPQNTQM